MSGNGRKLWLKKSLTWVNKTYVPIQGRRCQSMLCGSRILKLNITNMTIKSSRQENSVWQLVITRYVCEPPCTYLITTAARDLLGMRGGGSAKLQTLFSPVFMSGGYLTSAINPFSTETHFYHESRVWWTLLLTLWRVYGSDEINGHSLYYFDPQMNFWTCKTWNNKLNQ